MTEMFAYNSAAIDTFKTYFQSANNSPTQVKAASFTDISTKVDDLVELGVRVFPNPVTDGRLTIVGLSSRVRSIEVFDAKGALVARRTLSGERQWSVDIPSSGGTFLVAIRTDERTFVERVVALPR
jgi:hypothetical protein